MKRQSGFTLIEILTVIAISGVLLTLSAFAVRHFWMARSLDAGVQDVRSEMRRVQSKTVSESHPLVFGVWFAAGSASWGTLRFDPKDPNESGDDVCTAEGAARTFSSGVVVSDVSFASSTPQTSTCASVVPSGAQIAFFFARGTATPGSVTLSEPTTEGTAELSVSALTGRVERQ